MTQFCIEEALGALLGSVEEHTDAQASIAARESDALVQAHAEARKALEAM